LWKCVFIYPILHGIGSFKKELVSAVEPNLQHFSYEYRILLLHSTLSSIALIQMVVVVFIFVYVSLTATKVLNLARWQNGGSWRRFKFKLG
jgi:hypothetical protein